MSNFDNSQEMKIRKGQSYNLAILTAIADGKAHDNEYITGQFLRHLQFASILQKADPDQLATIVKKPKVLELIKALDEELKSV